MDMPIKGRHGRADGADAALRFYLEPLTPMLAAEGVTDVVVNRPGEIGVERNRRWEWHDDARLDFSWLESLSQRLAHFSGGQEISRAKPFCSAVLPGGERAQIVRPPAVIVGQFSLTIRKPPARAWTTRELEDQGVFDVVKIDDTDDAREELRALYRQRQWRAFLELAVKQRKNIVISGATGSTKTSFARAFLCHIPAEERLITGEDTFELRDLPQRNVVHMLYPKDTSQAVAQVRPKDLMESALRMRPDRVIFPELRDGTAYYFLRSVASGHPGVITTVHANSCAMAWEVLTLLVRESDDAGDLERADIMGLLRQTVDIVVQMQWTDVGPRVVQLQFNDAWANTGG
jgi:type IV secretion system protein VirB11